MAKSKGKPAVARGEKSSNEQVSCAEPAADRSWKLAQLAGILLGSARDPNVSARRKAKGDVLDASEPSNMLLSAALSRAETLLNWADGKGGKIHAYQLFAEGEQYTEEGITKVFQGVQWSSLQSKGAIIPFMESIRVALNHEFQILEELHIEGENMVAHELNNNIANAVIRVFEDQFGLERHNLPDRIGQNLSDLLATIHERINSHFCGSGGLEALEHYDREKMFIEWCFPADSFGRKIRRYRPHEIFCRCAKRNLFADKLVKERTSLALSAIPGPTRDLIFESFDLFDVWLAAERTLATEGDS